ncbi:hypothetical protein Gohar_004419 [Gossypium harknessii]|uniref:RNase H type-1 domain-containing protein n=1 Tax=Gossypium harknessii TaxID=34285 RepID=A0A7J9H5G5_9ROSI|nr:hypothetical protein [Gossypium harknessii]
MARHLEELSKKANRVAGCAPIKEIKARANSFESIEFRFIPRQKNRAVHLLVEEGRRCGAPWF